MVELLRLCSDSFIQWDNSTYHTLASLRNNLWQTHSIHKFYPSIAEKKLWDTLHVNTVTAELYFFLFNMYSNMLTSSFPRCFSFKPPWVHSIFSDMENFRCLLNNSNDSPGWGENQGACDCVWSSLSLLYFCFQKPSGHDMPMTTDTTTDMSQWIRSKVGH